MPDLHHTPADEANPERALDRLQGWGTAVVRFVVLTNAGGAVVILAFLTFHTPLAPGGGLLALMPLGVFLVGMALAGMAMFCEIVRWSAVSGARSHLAGLVPRARLRHEVLNIFGLLRTLGLFFGFCAFVLGSAWSLDFLYRVLLWVP